MVKTKTSATEVNLSNPQYYFNRELSWLEFNKRVLHEAMDPRTPLLERLKFLAIYSSNLDEYFMVRVAVLTEQYEAEVKTLTPDGRTPEQQLDEIASRLHITVEQQHRHFIEVLRPLLADQGVLITDYVELNCDQKLYLQKHFSEHIFPVLTPLAVDPGHPFPYISNTSLNLAVVLKDPDTQEELFARVKVPKPPRFITLPPELRSCFPDQHSIWTGVPIEQVIGHNLEQLFPGMIVLEYHPFRITRNAELGLQEDKADDLLLAIETELRKRRHGRPAVRLEIQSSMPESLKQVLIDELELDPTDIYEINGLLDLKDLMSLMSLPLPELKDPPWTATIPLRLKHHQESEETEDLFSIIKRGDLMLHHPYHSFISTVVRFIEQAASDPHVLAIKMTLYRTSGDSPIINALMSAAANGKQVAALVELKARFDEENNINWAKKLEQAGVHVVYGLVGLKTHTKIVLVVRKDSDKIRRYVHIGTGNYNHKTAALYTDLGLLTCREELGEDLTDLFNYLTGYSRQQSYRKLLVAPVNMRRRFLELIQREIDQVKATKSGRIVAKMNSLVDPQIIRALYEASIAGVSIDLIIRGICCLRPGIPEVSENIRVISIIGRYLEHSRIFFFDNGGQAEIYIGSADWMTRNLSRRVEAITPIDDPNIMKDLQEILGIFLSDNRQAWELQSDGTYIQRSPKSGEKELSAQKILMEQATH